MLTFVSVFVGHTQTASEYVRTRAKRGCICLIAATFTCGIDACWLSVVPDQMAASIAIAGDLQSTNAHTST